MRFTDGSGGFLSVPFSVTGERRVRRNVELFRAPFSESWNTAGDGRVDRLELPVSITLDVPAVPGFLLTQEGGSLLLEDGGNILFAEYGSVADVLAFIDNEAVYYETPFYSARLAARTRTAVVPTVQGFRVDMSFLLRDEPAYAFVIESEAGVSLLAEDGRLLEVSV